MDQHEHLADRFQQATAEVARHFVRQVRHKFDVTPHDLIVKRSPDRVVIEIDSPANWVRDLCEALVVDLQIANPNHEAWRWKNVKRKTDRDDALKLTKLSNAGQLSTVEIPALHVRQWRTLILYRASLAGDLLGDAA